MVKTRHIQARMSPRAINQRLLTVTARIGKSKIRGPVVTAVLNCKAIDLEVDELDGIRRDLTRARSKGGKVLVASTDGAEITTYRLESFSPRQLGSL